MSITPHQIPNPTGLSISINEIQDAMATIPWIELSFGLSEKGKDIRDGVPYFIPKVYGDNRERISLEPDDRYTFSFIEVTRPKIYASQQVQAYNFIAQQDVSVIVFANNEYISNTDDHLFIEKLIQDTENALIRVKSLDSFSNTDRGLEDAWGNYTISKIEDNFYKLNASTFRINFTVVYSQDCYQTPIYTNSTC